MIRSLLIDNYDSYSYNLFDLMARVNGTDPIVCRNDDSRCLELLDQVDCVVVSPGPGNPGNPADFALCSTVLETAEVPLLGVCLGHQGIGSVMGAQVARAPTARHGFVSRIRHEDDDLFTGIPQHFAAVRYHSLCVREPLPGDLQGLAWAEDGVLMALRHRHRPLWGVQFHPESVLTQYGAKLLTNFRAITEHHRNRTGGLGVTGAHTPGRWSYVAHLSTVDRPIPEETIFQELFRESDRAVWLDSAARGPGTGRFSYLAEASAVLGEKLTYRMRERSVLVETAGRQAYRIPGSIFDVLETELDRRSVLVPEVPFDFTGGFVGFFGYELKADLGATARHASDLPDSVWLFADRLAVIDHDEGLVHLLALTNGEAHTDVAAMSWLDQARATLLRARQIAGPAPAHPPAAAPRPLAEAALTRKHMTYLADIEYAKGKLLAGESYEVCVTNMLHLPRPADSFAFYRRLRRCNPAPYAAYLSLGEVEVACSSPERFLRVTRDRVVEARPIKGTAPRGRDQGEDERLRTALASSAKAIAENLMIVDLLRNDLSRVCEPGSVYVPALMRVESYATVHQLVSTIRGRLRGTESVVSAIRACFPGGSMTGAPKHRTMEIIDELESEARGVYSGAIGFLALNGTADLNIVIRTAVITDEELRVGAGGAIVLGSDPEEEYEEMLLKAVAPLRAYQAPDTDPLLTAVGSVVGSTPREYGGSDERRQQD